jgi:hypothetical protein
MPQNYLQLLELAQCVWQLPQFGGTAQLQAAGSCDLACQGCQSRAMFGLARLAAVSGLVGDICSWPPAAAVVFKLECDFLQPVSIVGQERQLGLLYPLAVVVRKQHFRLKQCSGVMPCPANQVACQHLPIGKTCVAHNTDFQ